MAVYYVRSSGGSDGNAGTSFALAKATISAAVGAMSNNDELRICAVGTHLPTAVIAPSTLLGITITGANATTGADDGSVATISGASLAAGNGFFTWATTNGHRCNYRNLRMTGSKAAAGGVSLTGGTQSVGMYNVRIDGSTGSGVYGDTGGNTLFATLCEFDTNNVGLSQSTTDRFAIYLIACSSHDNTGVGINNGSTLFMDHCLIYDNGSHGAQFNNGIKYINHCTFHRNTGSGIHCTAALPPIYGGNNIFASNTAYGVNHSTTQRTLKEFWVRNLYYNNTSGNVNINSGSVDLSDFLAITGSDPLFVSTSNGAEDFALQGGSPAKGAGMPGVMLRGGTSYLDIGAIQSQASGGSTIVRPAGWGNWGMA